MHARTELMGTITPTNIVSDAQALLAHADQDPAARDGKIGAVGLCMSGGLTISLARALPERVTAAASIHGAWLVRDTPDSPHRDLDGVRAEVHMAWCENAPPAPMSDLDVMRPALEDAGITSTLALHDQAQHGLPPTGPRTNQPAPH